MERELEEIKKEIRKLNKEEWKLEERRRRQRETERQKERRERAKWMERVRVSQGERQELETLRELEKHLQLSELRALERESRRSERERHRSTRKVRRLIFFIVTVSENIQRGFQSNQTL